MAGRVVLDEIVEKFTLDYKDYVDGANKVVSANQKIKSSSAGMGSHGGARTTGKSFLADMASEALNVGEGIGEALGPIGTVVTAVLVTATAGVAALGAAGKKAFEDFANFDSMTKALEAVERSAKRATESMRLLYEIAKAPGIGFQEAVGSYVALRNANVSGDFARSLIKETANANALGGGTVETFQRAMLAISQMAMKPYLQGEELLQLMEANIPAARFVKDKFGTTDTEQLKKQGITSQMVLQGLVEEMAKLPRVAGGAQNSIDNFVSAVQMASVSIGAAISGTVGGTLDSFSDAIEKATHAGLFAEAVNHFADAIGLAGINSDVAKEALLNMVAAFMTLSDYLGVFIAATKEFAKNLGPLGNWAIKGLTGFDIQKWANDEENPFGSNSFMEGNRRTLDMMMALETQKNAKKTGQTIADAAATEKPTDQTGLVAKQQNDYLSRIASNTDNLARLHDAIMGGGTIAHRGFSREEIGGLGRGYAGGNRTVRGLLNHLADLIEGAGISAVGTFNQRAV